MTRKGKWMDEGGKDRRREEEEEKEKRRRREKEKERRRANESSLIFRLSELFQNFAALKTDHTDLTRKIFQSVPHIFSSEREREREREKKREEEERKEVVKCS